MRGSTSKTTKAKPKAQTLPTIIKRLNTLRRRALDLANDIEDVFHDLEGWYDYHKDSPKHKSQAKCECGAALCDICFGCTSEECEENDLCDCEDDAKETVLSPAITDAIHAGILKALANPKVVAGRNDRRAATARSRRKAK